MQLAHQRIVHMSTAQLITFLDLKPHPEGGWYRETYVYEDPAGGRPHATAIYFLLANGETSHWHRVDTHEIWLFHAGTPLVLSVADEEGGPATEHLVGPDLAAGHIPQINIPPNRWKTARSLGDWTLCACVCTPGFTFDTFELAPESFDLPRA